jgi:triosephosphate isomerase
MEFLEGRSLPGVEALMERGVSIPEGRRPLIAGNWKMYKTRPATLEYLREFIPLVRSAGERDVVVCPPFVCLETAIAQALRTNVAIGAQTMAAGDEGAQTGEVSPEMLRELGVHYVILGHSERRDFPSDTDRMLAHKVRAALNKGLRPILCVGETLEEREGGLTESKLGRQIDAGLADVSAAEFALVAVAYEPIWAIGTGLRATPALAQETIAFIRDRLRTSFVGAADVVRILYGGSVNGASIDALMAEPDIDGVLVGGASLQPDEFARIVRYAEPE